MSRACILWVLSIMWTSQSKFVYTERAIETFEHSALSTAHTTRVSHEKINHRAMPGLKRRRVPELLGALVTPGFGAGSPLTGALPTSGIHGVLGNRKQHSKNTGNYFTLMTIYQTVIALHPGVSLCLHIFHACCMCVCVRVCACHRSCWITCQFECFQA